MESACQHDMGVQPDFNLAVEGNIGSGKTTLMKGLERLFMYIPFRYEKVSTWKFLSKYYEDPATYAGALQLEILFSSQENLLYSSRITERSTHSAYWCFATMLRDDGIFREPEFKLYEQVWQAYNDLPTHILYVDTPPHVCLERIRERNRGGEENITLEYLEKLDAYHKMFLERMKDEGVHVFRIDGRKSMNELRIDVASLFTKELNLYTAERRIKNAQRRSELLFFGQYLIEEDKLPSIADTKHCEQSLYEFLELDDMQYTLFSKAEKMPEGPEQKAAFHRVYSMMDVLKPLGLAISLWALDEAREAVFGFGEDYVFKDKLKNLDVYEVFDLLEERVNGHLGMH